MGEMSVVVSTIALMLGAGWASGINLYAAMLAIGIMGNSATVQDKGDIKSLAARFTTIRR